MVGSLLLAGALLLQQAPEISVGIRPQSIRVGDRAVVTVRILSAVGPPELMDFIPPPGLILEDIRDRSSSGASWLLERELHLLGELPGEHVLPPVQVVVGGVMVEVESPGLTVVASPLHWPQREAQRQPRNQGSRREPDPVVPQGTPPSSGEMAEAQPQNQGGYSPWGYPGYLPGYSPQTPGLPGQMPGMFLGYPGMGYFPTPYGPNGGWPISPPGSTPGVGIQGWPAGVPGQGYYPGGSTGGYPSGYPSGYPGGYPGIGVPGAPGYPPGTGNPGQGVPTLPAIPGGQWPAGMGGGWAETAAGDPWWPEIVPELHSYGGWIQNPPGDASLAAGLTPVRVFVGQQATLVATATFRPGAFLGQGASPEYLPPSPPDFWVVDLPDPPLPLPTSSQGGVDQGYTFRRALFPTRAGEYVVPPAALLLPREGAGGTGVAWDTLLTEPMPVSVVPVPRAPGISGYAGVVGRYRLEAGISPTRLAVGEAALLVVRILGVGNVRDVPAPEIGPIYGAEIAPGGDGAVVEIRDGVVGGVRTFSWLVVPTEPGPLRIDPILFSYFDPYLGDFGQVASSELMLEVTEFPGGGR